MYISVTPLKRTDETVTSATAIAVIPVRAEFVVGWVTRLRQVKAKDDLKANPLLSG
jgi:hypothetical protein